MKNIFRFLIGLAGVYLFLISFEIGGKNCLAASVELKTMLARGFRNTWAREFMTIREQAEFIDEISELPKPFIAMDAVAYASYFIDQITSGKYRYKDADGKIFVADIAPFKKREFVLKVLRSFAFTQYEGRDQFTLFNRFDALYNEKTVIKKIPRPRAILMSMHKLHIEEAIKPAPAPGPISPYRRYSDLPRLRSEKERLDDF